MEWMVCIIYVIVVGQFINSKFAVKGKGTHRGHYFYRMSAGINLIIGPVGMIAVNLLLRDKGIIPEPFVLAALVGFFLVAMYGAYCCYKMLTCVEP